MRREVTVVVAAVEWQLCVYGQLVGNDSAAEGVAAGRERQTTSCYIEFRNFWRRYELIYMHDFLI